MSERHHVTVIGAGIVGMACAVALLRDGHRVTVLDPDEPGANTSFGNAGGISNHNCIPMAGPGIIKQVPKWLLDPLGPLAIRPAYLPKLLPWLLRFVAAGTRARIKDQSEALRSLYHPVVEEHLALAKWVGCPELFHRNGALYVYETEAAFQGAAANREIMRGFGIELQELNGDELRQLEPSLSPMFVRATFFPNGAHCANPGGYVERIADAFRRGGGEILARKVNGFEIGTDGVRRIRTDGGDMEADRIVISAGAWSHRLTAQLGDAFPLESERGYHMTLPHSNVETRRPISFVERRFMCTPMDMGFRLAGTVEFSGLEAPPNYDRSDQLIAHAKRAFASIDTTDGSRWMGQRPATPDSLPVIGRATRHDKVVYAFGHGHLGLTGSAVTAKHVADLVAGRTPSIDLSPFRVDRY